MPVQHVVRLIERRVGSVVVDLFLVSPEERIRDSRKLLGALIELRRRTGLPHWIITDEAHALLGQELAGGPGGTAGVEGLCLVTYLPGMLCADVAAGVEIDLEVRGPDEVVLTRSTGGPATVFRPRRREVAHVRHWHKYTLASVAQRLRFFFAGPAGAAGASASNLTVLHRHLDVIADGVIAFHAGRGDFSRWIRDVFRDTVLAARVRRIEQTLAGGRSASRVRADLQRALERRYLLLEPRAIG